ncbi:MAG: beta-propeller fold lactonase family protein [Candidatus Sulfotelmatobacter sp.]
MPYLLMPNLKRRAALAASLLATLLLVFSGNLARAQNQLNIPQPEFVIVANQISQNVSVYAIDADSGALVQVPGSPFPAGIYPDAVAIAPNGKFAYVANQTWPYYQGYISTYAINPATGVLTTVEDSPFFNSQGQPYGLAINPTGQFLYTPGVFTDVVSGYTINPTSGNLTSISGSFGTASQPEGIAIDPTGKFIYAPNSLSDDVSAYAINPASGALIQVEGSPFPTGGATPAGIENMAFDPAGRFAYVTNVNSGTISIFSIDPASGALRAIQGSPFQDPDGAPYPVTVDPAGKFLYVGNVGGNNISVFAINAISGAITPIAGSPFPAGGYPSDVVIDHTGRFAYMTNSQSNNISAYTIAKSGGLTPVAGSPFPAGTTPFGIAITPVRGLVPRR